MKELAGLEINRGYFNHFRRWAAGDSGQRSSLMDRLLYGRPAQVLCMPLVFIAALLMWARLSLWRALSPARPIPDLHKRALDFVDGFVAQYPLHLYPIVCKAIELAFLKARLQTDVQAGSRVLEVAIGEGTLSRRLFEPSQSITAVDLSPFDLFNAARLPHVAQAVVGDGLNPPFSPGRSMCWLPTTSCTTLRKKRVCCPCGPAWPPLDFQREHADMGQSMDRAVCFAASWTRGDG